MRHILLLSLFVLASFLAQSQSVAIPTARSPYVGTPHTGIYSQGDTVYYFGDSYTFGSGASTSAKRWTSLLSTLLGCVESNFGVAGKTLMLQPPQDYQGPLSMTQTLSTIPTKTANRKMLVFAFGLNDMGQTATAYSLINYRAAMDTVIANAISKGWTGANILIIPPYWIGQAGYTVYGTLTGNAAPTYVRHQSFVNGTKDEAIKYNTLYVDVYSDQNLNDTTLIGADHIHPTDSGYYYIYYDIAQYLGSTPTAATIFSQTGSLINSITSTTSLQLGQPTGVSQATPNFLTLGGQFTSSGGQQGKLKFKLYEDGVTANATGFGVSAGLLEYHMFSGQHQFYVAGNSILGIGNLGLGRFVKLGAIATGVPTTVPDFISLGNTYSSTTGSEARIKLRIYDNGTTRIGLGFSADAFEYHSGGAEPHKFYTDSTLFMTIGVGSFVLNPAMIPTGSSDSLLTMSSTGQVKAIAQSVLAGGVSIVGSFSGSSQTNGASISTNTITFGPADATNPGMVTTGAQSLSGVKTFANGAVIGGGAYTGSTGAEFKSSNITINNAVTAANGTLTVGQFNANAFLAPVVTSTNTNITYTDPATVYINTVPVMSTNSVLSGRAWSLYLNGGPTRLGPATTDATSLSVPEGTSPTSPVAGDLWTTSSDHNINYFTNSVSYIVPKTLTNTATLDFPSTAGGASSDLTLTVTGAAVGDVVNIGVPNVSTVSNGCFTAWVSATNTVKVRFTNNDLVTAFDPASGTFRAAVVKY